MKITESRIMEDFLMQAYLKSRKNDYILKSNMSAREFINKFLDYIDVIDRFNGTNHTKIVHKLYFHRNNLLSCSMEFISLQVFVPTRTLSDYRKKYAIIINKVLREI